MSDNSNVPVIFIRNKSDRNKTNEKIQAISNDHCNCCGAYLKSVPWNKTYGLCQKCESYISKRFATRKTRIPWYVKDEI